MNIPGCGGIKFKFMAIQTGRRPGRVLFSSAQWVGKRTCKSMVPEGIALLASYNIEALAMLRHCPA